MQRKIGVNLKECFVPLNLYAFKDSSIRDSREFVDGLVVVEVVGQVLDHRDGINCQVFEGL